MGMARAYLLESDAGLVLVDAGLPRYERRVLRRLTGAPIAIHRADGDAMARGETPLGSVRGRGWLLWALLPPFEPCLRPEPT